jgi:hypothetical protein
MAADFSRLTVVSVTGVAGPLGGEAAAPSLIHCAAQLPGCRALMISPERPASLPAHIEHRKVKPFGYIVYSAFMLYALEYFIETDFVLVTQPDGWVLDGANWRDEFFDFDYIGAPSVTGLVIEPDGRQDLYNFYRWQAHLGRSGVTVRPVLNGGFSLRSRRFLSAPRRLGLSIEIPPPNLVYFGEADLAVFELDWPFGQNAEDVQLCVLMREALTADGLRFAPLALALDFSVEYIGEVIHEGRDFSTTFGVHCKYRRFLGGTPPVIDWTGDADDLAVVYRQAEFNEFLKTRYNYTITI